MQFFHEFPLVHYTSFWAHTCSHQNGEASQYLGNYRLLGPVSIRRLLQTRENIWFSFTCFFTTSLSVLPAILANFSTSFNDIISLSFNKAILLEPGAVSDLSNGLFTIFLRQLSVCIRSAISCLLPSAALGILLARFLTSTNSQVSLENLQTDTWLKF